MSKNRPLSEVVSDNLIEGDSYLYNGDVWTSQISNFKALYALQPDPATANYNQDIIIQHRNFTLQNSIQKVSSRSLARY